MALSPQSYSTVPKSPSPGYSVNEYQVITDWLDNSMYYLASAIGHFHGPAFSPGASETDKRQLAAVGVAIEGLDCCFCLLCEGCCRSCLFRLAPFAAGPSACLCTEESTEYRDSVIALIIC